MNQLYKIGNLGMSSSMSIGDNPYLSQLEYDSEEYFFHWHYGYVYDETPFYYKDSKFIDLTYNL